MTDNYVLALEKDRGTRLAELERCRSEVERFVAELNRSETALEYWKAKTASAEADVDRLTRERDEAHRDWRAELDGNAALRAKHGARPDETLFQFIARLADGHAAAESWKARAEAAEADNAAFRSLLQDGLTSPESDDAWADRVIAILSVPHPGAALLERLRTAEASARAWQEQHKQTERLRRSQGDRLDAAVSVVEACREVVKRIEPQDCDQELFASARDLISAYDAANEEP